MRTLKRNAAVVSGLIAAVMVLPSVAIGSIDSYQLVSQNSEGIQANGSSFSPDLSSDGRYVVFTSSASNLVPGDTIGTHDVFVKDVFTGAVERVSVATDGSQMGGAEPTISADGRYVAFVKGTRAYVRDRQAGTTKVASPFGYHSGPFSLSISRDGRYVAFTTLDDLIPEDTNSCLPLPPGMPPPQDYDYCNDVYMQDMLTDTLTRVSVASNGAQGNRDSGPGLITSDGRFVVFSSAATNLAPRDVNKVTDLFIRDLSTGTTRMLSRGLDGGQSNGDSYTADVSADGRFVAFISNAKNLAVGGQSPLPEVYVLDVSTGNVTVESTVIRSTTPGLKFFLDPSISDDGRMIAFSVASYNGVAITIDAFVRDRVKGSTVEIAPRPRGDDLTFASLARLSGDGGSLVFRSNRQWLVPGDTNGVADAFLLRLSPTCLNGGREDGTVSSVIRTVDPEPLASTTNAINCEVLVPAKL